jgi:hypothetical protein
VTDMIALQSRLLDPSKLLLLNDRRLVRKERQPHGKF